MTVAQFIEWLKTQDQSALVCVLTTSPGQIGGLYERFDPNYHVTYDKQSQFGPWLELGLKYPT